jgi:hypothetical protein
VSVEWNDIFPLFEHYSTLDGDCNVPANHIEGGEKLGSWVACSRHLFKKKGQLSQAKIDRLGEIEFVWNVSEAYWNYC